jgi:transcription elongation GreA/GreB family factor
VLKISLTESKKQVKDEDSCSKTLICLNQPLKIRFSDGEELNVVVIDQRPQGVFPDLPMHGQSCYWCSKDSPLGQALIGHFIGESIEYKVAETALKVTVLKVIS